MKIKKNAHDKNIKSKRKITNEYISPFLEYSKPKKVTNTFDLNEFLNQGLNTTK